MKKVTTLIALLLLAVSHGAYAQKTITGKAINGEDGLPMPGVSVVVKGTTTATATNAAGNFSLTVPNNRAIIVISFMGYKTVEVPVGSNTQFIFTLKPDPQVLGEVFITARRNNQNERVVTAMGIERDVKTLPYAVYQISGDELRRAGNPNLLKGLVGKVPNLTVREWGRGVGAPVLAYGRRGIISLYVIDGIPHEISVERDSRGRIIDVYDDVVSKINLLNVESITFLPSANAAMLYGSKGANGAILITTKR